MLKGEDKASGRAILQVYDMTAALAVVDSVGNEMGGRRLQVRIGHPDAQRSERGERGGDRRGRGRGRGRREPRSHGFNVLRDNPTVAEPLSEPNSPEKQQPLKIMRT